MSTETIQNTEEVITENEAGDDASKVFMIEENNLKGKGNRWLIKNLFVNLHRQTIRTGGNSNSAQDYEDYSKRNQHQNEKPHEPVRWQEF